jgi:hypothetical protein
LCQYFISSRNCADADDDDVDGEDAFEFKLVLAVNAFVLVLVLVNDEFERGVDSNERILLW